MMNNRYVKFGALCLFFLFIQLKSNAQHSLEGLDLDGDVYQWYDNALGLEKSGVVLGAYQEINRQSRNSHQFFMGDLWLSNPIRYRGQVYDSIFLLYDIYDDILIIRYPEKLQYYSQPIKLLQDQVDWFKLAGHTFKYYPNGILQVSPGFFDQLYVGDHFDLIAKRIKQVQIENTSVIYVSSDKYIIRCKDEYHRFRRKGSILKLFKGQKREIRQFIKQKGLSIKPGNDQDLVLLARFCDELLKNQ